MARHGRTLDPHPSREPRAATLASAVTARARAAALAAALVLLVLAAPAQAQGIEELLETLVPPLQFLPPNIPSVATGTVPLRQGATYRVVVTGVVTQSSPPRLGLPPLVTMADALYFFFCSISDFCQGALDFGPVLGTGAIVIRLINPPINDAIMGVRLNLPDGSFPPFDPGHRYETTFVAGFNGVLETFIPFGFVSPDSNVTSTHLVELFGERTPSCANRAAMTEAIPEPGCPVSSCDGRPATIEAVEATPGFPAPPTFGTPDDDVIVGTEEDDQLFGRGGNDVICGLGGNDLILGNKDRDRLIGGPGDDQILGGDDDARDILEGGDGRDRLVGGPGDDELDGGPGADRMIGGPGDDTLFVGGLSFVPSTGGGSRIEADVLLGGPGDDLADYSGLSRPVTVSLRDTEQDEPDGGVLARETLISIEDLRGTRFNDILSGDDRSNSLFGGRGRDVLLGNGGRDILRGERDTDALIGGTGPDVLKGGSGRDGCCVDTADDRRRPGDCEIERTRGVRGC